MSDEERVEDNGQSAAQLSQACAGCRQAHALCDRKNPCWRCVQLGKADSCQPAPMRKRGRPPKNKPPTGDPLDHHRTSSSSSTAPSPGGGGSGLRPLKATAMGSAVGGGGGGGVGGFLPVLGAVASSTSANVAVLPVLPQMSRIPQPLPRQRGPNGFSSSAATEPTVKRHKRTAVVDSNNDAAAEAAAAAAAESSITQALVRMLVDEVRDVKQENGDLRRKVSKLQARLKESERRLEEVLITMEAMTNAQKESAVQIRTLTALFQASPSPPPSLAASSLVSTAHPPSSSFSSSSSSSLELLQAPSSPPSSSAAIGRGGDTSLGVSTFRWGAEGSVGPDLARALPFLADYDCSSLVVSDLREPFLVLRKDAAKWFTHIAAPVIAFISPAACAFLGYTPEEVVGQSTRRVGNIDSTEKVKLVPLMFNEPSSGVGPYVPINGVFLPKNGTPMRMEALHQNVWADSQPKWHFLRLVRVLEVDVPMPAPWSIDDMLRDPRCMAIIDAKLAAFLKTRPLADLHPVWRVRARAACFPSLTGLYTGSSSSPSSSSSSLSPSSSSSSSSPHESNSSSPSAERTDCGAQEDNACPLLMSLATLDGEEDHHHHQQEEEDESSPQQAVDVGIDLDEMLRTLRSPAPPTPPPQQEFEFGWASAPDSPSPFLDVDRWLHQQQG